MSYRVAYITFSMVIIFSMFLSMAPAVCLWLIWDVAGIGEYLTNTRLGFVPLWLSLTGATIIWLLPSVTFKRRGKP